MKYWFKLFREFYSDPVVLMMEKQDARFVTTYQKMLLRAINDDEGVIKFCGAGENTDEELGISIHVSKRISKKT